MVIAGLGGQGVIKASDILADVAFSAGLDVKKSELHGMSQRGGSVSSDVRFGERVFSPMVPEGEADFLVVLAPDQVAVNAAALLRAACSSSLLKSTPPPQEQEKHQRGAVGGVEPPSAVSRRAWTAALKRNLPEKLHEANLQSFSVGRARLMERER